MESIISTFHIDWKIIVAQALNFAVVFVVLYIYALKPLNKLMAERGEKISKGLDDAKSSALMLKETGVRQEEVLAKARKEAEVVFQTGKAEAETKRVEMLEQTKNEVTKMVEDGKRMLEAEKAKMVAEAKSEIVALTMLATEKILGEKVDGAVGEKVLKDLGHMK